MLPAIIDIPKNQKASRTLVSARRKRLLSRDEYADQDDEGAPGMGSSPEAEGDVVAMDGKDKGVRLGSMNAASCCWLQ